MEDNTILFRITQDQGEKICKFCYKDINKLENYEICELLDKIIDRLE